VVGHRGLGRKTGPTQAMQRITISPRTGVVALAIVAMLGLSQPLAAQLDRRPLMADAILGSQHAGLLLDEKRITDAVVDARARILFRQLRPDPQWNPAHPAWKANFAQFKREVQQLIPADDAQLKTTMRVALLRDFDEIELAEIDAAMADPGFGESIKAVADAGLDPSFAFRITSMGRQPELYAADEIEEVRRTVNRLQQKEKDLMASERTRNAVARLDSPAFRKYQQSMIAVIEERATGNTAAAGNRAAIEELLARWRAKVGS